MKIILILALLLSLAFGQTYTLTLPGGSVTAPLLPGGGDALEVRHRHGGKPDNWGWSQTPSRSWGWTPGAPIQFYVWEVFAPDHTMLAGGLYGARNPEPGRWVLADVGDWKVPARRNGVELWPQTATMHRLFPGDTLYARLAPAKDPWELGYLATEITPERKKLALKIMGFDEDRLSRWPWLRRVLGWYCYDWSSINPNTPAGSRNCGWLLVPANFAKRWWINDPSPIAHWYGLGSRSAAGGENLVNEHYGSDAAWIGRGLRDDDPVALTIGLYLLRHKIAYGLIDCDDTTNWMWGKWRNEKGDHARGTTGMAPSPAKEYDKGLAMASVLLPDEPIIKRAAAIRRAYLLTAQRSWSGSGGLRNLGHFLENLRHWWVATGDERYRSKAESEITYALGIVGQLPYIPENKATGQAMSGEGVCALAAMRWWGFPQHKAKLDALLAWHVQNGIAQSGQTPYEIYVKADGTVTQKWSGVFQGCNWLQVPGLPPDVAAKVEQVMFTKYAATPTCDATFGGEGPGWEKWVPWIVNWGACGM